MAAGVGESLSPRDNERFEIDVCPNDSLATHPNFHRINPKNGHNTAITIFTAVFRGFEASTSSYGFSMARPAFDKIYPSKCENTCPHVLSE